MTNIEKSLEEAEEHMKMAKEKMEEGTNGGLPGCLLDVGEALYEQNLALYEQNKSLIKYLERIEANTTR